MAIKHEAVMGRGDVYRLNPDLIAVKEGRNPRQAFGDEEDATFVEFIVQNGAAFPPITVRKVKTPGEDYFELVEGERRLR